MHLFEKTDFKGLLKGNFWSKIKKNEICLFMILTHPTVQYCTLYSKHGFNI